jgi:hypothetical protein
MNKFMKNCLWKIYEQFHEIFMKSLWKVYEKFMKMYKMREMSHCQFLNNFIFFCTIVLLKKWYSGIALAS